MLLSVFSAIAYQVCIEEVYSVSNCTKDIFIFFVNPILTH